MRSCISHRIRIIAAGSLRRSPSAALRCAADDPDALYREREDLASARAPRRSGSARLAADPRDFESAWKLARGALLARRRTLRAAEREARSSNAASRPAADGERARARTARGTLLDGRQHGRARRVVRHAPGAEIPRRHQGRARDRAAARPGVSSRAPPIARSAAGTSRCRGCSAAATRSRRSTCASRSPTTRTARPRTSSWPKRCSSSIASADARAELQQVIDGPVDPDWAPEDREFKEQAAARLKKEKR